MPRPKKQPAAQPNSIVASAARITARRQDRPLGNGMQGWQGEGWGFFDTVGELAFAVQWQANAMSQVELRLVREDADGNISEVLRTDTDPRAVAAHEAMDALFQGDTGQEQMMAAFGTHLSVPGEAYLVGLPPAVEAGDMGQDAWMVVSNDELKETTQGSGKWRLERGDGVERILDVSGKDGQEPDALIIRVWRPHPRKHIEATSPVRAALPVLRELQGLTKHVASSIDSRLAGAGILLVPSEMTFQTPPTDGSSPSDAQADDFLMALTEAMQAALSDQGSPAARVPIVVKAPGAFLDSIKHITFDSPLSQEAQSLREEAIRRLALSLDMPPEVLLGQADSNHWSAWLISEDAIKIHVEPLAKVVTDALVSRYLWPAMQGQAPIMDPAIMRYKLVADTTKLRQRAAGTSEALELHTRMVISDAALLRETRFDAGDAPSPDERKRRFMEKVAMGAPPPEVVAAALSVVLGKDVMPAPVAAPAPAAPPVPEPATPPPPAIEAPREPPAPAGEAAASTSQQAAALLAASEVLVLRAVEKGWNRAGRRGRTRTPVASSKLDECLKDAWHGGSGDVARIAALCGVDSTRLEATVDHYARALLTTGADHDPRQFARLLADRVLDTPMTEAG